MQTGSGKVTGEGQRSRWRLGWERIGRSHTRLCIYTTTTDAQCTSGTDQWNTVTVFPQFMQKLFFPFGFFQLHKQLICSMIISFFHTLQIKMGAQYIFHFVQIKFFFLSLYINWFNYVACLSLPSIWTTSHSGGQFAWLFWSQDFFLTHTHIVHKCGY